jgi:hypothetical protein
MMASTLVLKSQSYWQESDTLVELTAENDFISASTTNSNAVFSFLESLDKRNVDSGLLPPGLRVSIPGCVIFERPPSMQLVQYIDASVSEISEYEDNGSYYSDDDEESGEYREELNSYTYRIPVPWQLYIATYSTNPSSMYRVTSIKMYFMNGPLNNPDVQVYAPYVNNFFANASLCTPMFDTIDEIERYPQNVAGVIASAYDWVWNTGFNADLYECLDLNLSSHVTKNNPLVADFRQKYSNRELGHLSIYAAFYKYLSDFTTTDIINLEWSSPSYAHHFDLDRDFLFLNDEKLMEEFRQSDFYNPDSGDMINDFKNWLPSQQHRKKTYSGIINAMFFWKNTRSMGSNIYSDLIKSNNLHLDNVNYFTQSLINHIHVNPS